MVSSIGILDIKATTSWIDATASSRASGPHTEFVSGRYLNLGVTSWPKGLIESKTGLKGSRPVVYRVVRSHRQSDV